MLKVLAKALLQSCLEKALLEKGVLAEAMLVKSPKMVVKPVGKGDAYVGADAACRRLEKSLENAPELISSIFRDLSWTL